MPRSLAAYVVIFAIGLGCGLGAVAVADSRSGADASAADLVVVQQLQQLNKTAARTLNRIEVANKNLTGHGNVPTHGKPIKPLLLLICRNTAPTPDDRSNCGL